MKHIKKISSIILALVMVLAMGTSVFAAQELDTVGDHQIEVKTSDGTLSIPKTIIVTNPEEIKVFGPTIKYAFSAKPATVAAGTKVTSNAGRSNADDVATSTVQAGPAGGVVVSTQPSFATGETAAVTGTKGVELTSNIVVTTDINSFTKAGIYRYEITDDTEKSVLDEAGITRESDYNASRFLDVYIYNGTNGLEIGGYTLLKSNATDITGDNDGNFKSPGFISGSEKDETTGKVSTRGSEPTDLYNTINASLEKEVTGALGDKTNLFPFAIAVSNNGGMTYYTTNDPAAAVQGTSSAATEVSQSLKHGDKFFIKGLNPKAKLTFVETNNTKDDYTVTVNNKKAALVAATLVTAGNTQTSGENAVSNYASSETQDVAAVDNANIKFINDLSEVSPTNVVMRFAPYLFILGGAMMLLVASRRRKSDQE